MVRNAILENHGAQIRLTPLDKKLWAPARGLVTVGTCLSAKPDFLGFSGRDDLLLPWALTAYNASSMSPNSRPHNSVSPCGGSRGHIPNIWQATAPPQNIGGGLRTQSLLEKDRPLSARVPARPWFHQPRRVSTAVRGGRMKSSPRKIWMSLISCWSSGSNRADPWPPATVVVTVGHRPPNSIHQGGPVAVAFGRWIIEKEKAERLSGGTIKSAERKVRPFSWVARAFLGKKGLVERFFIGKHCGFCLH